MNPLIIQYYETFAKHRRYITHFFVIKWKSEKNKIGYQGSHGILVDS
jgi:hypothetical protein